MKAFEPGDKVRVTEGVFAHFPGVVTDVSADRKKVRVSVTIFSRSTALELDVAHVQRAG
jgi:transcription termination/antitermination protein NusG